MKRGVMRLVSLDPGTHTGVCHFDTETRSWETLTLGPQPHHSTLWNLLRETGVERVIYERFTYQRRDKVVLDSVEYIGVIKLFCQLNNVQDYCQTPSQAKNLWTDDKLKALHLYAPAYPHENDAVRHMLYHLVVTHGDRSWLDVLRPS